LYVVATPIGNIFDISFRAIHILNQSKYIFAEDTRQSKKLLNFYEINTPLIACHEHNEISVASKIEKGEIYALISDAGTPLISDPGYRIVNRCIEIGIDVFPIPGASSVIAALSASGMPTDKFLFNGFLPPKSQARKSSLQEIKDIKASMIFLESPNRISATLTDMLEVLGNRRCCVCREITKIYEEFLRGNISDLLDHFSREQSLGEFVIIVEAAGEIGIDTETAFLELADLLKKETLKTVVEKISKKYKLPRKAVYEKALQLKSLYHID